MAASASLEDSPSQQRDLTTWPTPVSTPIPDPHCLESPEPLKPLDESGRVHIITALWNGFRRNNVPSALQDGLAIFLVAPLELINNTTLRELDITLLVHHVGFRVDLNYMPTSNSGQLAGAVVKNRRLRAIIGKR